MGWEYSCTFCSAWTLPRNLKSLLSKAHNLALQTLEEKEEKVTQDPEGKQGIGRTRPSLPSSPFISFQTVNLFSVLDCLLCPDALQTRFGWSRLTKSEKRPKGEHSPESPSGGQLLCTLLRQIKEGRNFRNTNIKTYHIHSKKVFQDTTMVH